MATQAQAFSTVPSDERTLPMGGLALDWATVALSSWLIGGVYLDGWAHNHGMFDNTFFTPWHAVLYAGFGALALLLAVVALRGIMRGRAWTRAMPAGYDLSLLGAAI